jgi:hypothetical protein
LLHFYVKDSGVGEVDGGCRRKEIDGLPKPPHWFGLLEGPELFLHVLICYYGHNRSMDVASLGDFGDVLLISLERNSNVTVGMRAMNI